jgi:hypothetical protein
MASRSSESVSIERRDEENERLREGPQIKKVIDEGDSSNGNVHGGENED